MFTIILLGFILVILFLVLGFVADKVVSHTKFLGSKLGIKLFFLGLLLGAFTNLPELSVALNSTANNIPEVSLGNLFGGLIVLFGLILGMSVIMNKSIETDGKMKNFLPIVIFLFLPLLLGLDGGLGFIDGLIIILLYIALMAYLYKRNKGIDSIAIEFIEKKGIIRHVLYIVCGMILLLVISNIIIRTTLFMLSELEVPGFMIGLLLFSIGTNLPEITISFQSWRKSSGDLSLSSLIGSALANRLVIGLVALMGFVPMSIGINYYFLMFVTASLLLLLFIFYETGKVLTRTEGLFLILLYVLFLAGEIILYMTKDTIYF